ncbi:MAG: IPT/TIG domain-containing protein [Candidatus Solibacter sp.]
MRHLLAVCAAASAVLSAQAPTAPVISARGVTNFFTQEPAPGIVGQGGLVQINGLNLGPPEGLTAGELPWPTRLGDTQVSIGGKPAAIYSVTPGTILAQVPLDSNIGLVNVIVRRAGVSSTPAKVTVAAMAPSVRTADDSGAGLPWGKITADAIAMVATGLGPTDPKLESGEAGPADKPAVPTADIYAYVGGMRAKVTAAASSTRPAVFDINIAVPAGARRGDLITLFAGRQAGNPTVFAPLAEAEVLFVPLPAGTPPITTLADTGVNGSFLLAYANRDADGCYPALSVNMRGRKAAAIADCLTSVNANIQPLAIPGNGDSIAALVGPPAGDAQTGISSTVKIFSAAGDTIKVDLPSAASTLTATVNGVVAAMPGKTPQIATIDPETGAFQTSAPGAGGAGGAPVTGAPAPGGGAAPTVDLDGLKHVYAFANVGQNRIAVIAGDDSLKPTKAAFAILTGGEVTISKPFPAAWLPLLTAVAPARPNQPAPTALPTVPVFFDGSTRRFFVLSRAADASKDAFLAFGLTDTDPKIVDFPEGWFAASCTADIRLFPLDLVGQLALAGAKVADSEFKTNCAATAFLTLDFSDDSMAAIALNDQGQIRVPAARTDVSMALMNNYVYGVKLDSTRATTSDTLYVLDGVNGNAVTLPVPAAVTAFTSGTLQQIPEMNSLLVQTFDKVGGDQGFVLFNLDTQLAANLPLPEGFASVATLNDNGSVCCLATRKLISRAIKPGGSSVVVYQLGTGDVAVVPNPDNVTSLGPAVAANGANAANAARVVIANAQANTISAVAYNGNRQVGIVVIRIP